MKKFRLLHVLAAFTGLTCMASLPLNSQTSVIEFNESVSTWQTAYDTSDVDVIFVSSLFEYNNAGYNDLTNVGWTNSGSSAIIEFIPAPGKQVTLDSFDLGNFNGNGGAVTYKIYDVTDLVTPLMTSSPFTVNYDEFSHPTFSPNVTSSNGLRLVISPDLFHNAIDNITFTSADSGTPSTATSTTMDFATVASTWQTDYDTAEVDVSLVSNLYSYVGSGYNDLVNVAYTDAATAGIIELIPQSGFQVALNSFDLGNFGGFGSTTQFSVYDVTDLSTPLISSTGITVNYNSSSHPSYEYNVSSTSGLRIVFGPDFYNIAADNVVFTSTPISSTPTGTSSSITFDEPPASWQSAYDSADVDISIVSNLYQFTGTGYGDLTNVAYTDDTASAIIEFIPSSGKEVTLDSLDLGNYLGFGGTTQIEVYDTTDLGTPLFTLTGLSVPYSPSSHSNFPINVTSSNGLRLVLGPDMFNIAVDNIDYSIDDASAPTSEVSAVIEFDEPEAKWNTAYDTAELDVEMVSTVYKFDGVGYNDLTNVAYTGIGGTLTIDFTPTSGNEVTIDSIDLGNFLGNGGTTEIEVFDITNLSTPLYSSSTISVAYNSSAHLTQTIGVTSANGLRLAVGPDAYNIALDNIAITTAPAGTTTPSVTSTIDFDAPISTWQTSYDSSEVDVVVVSNLYQWPTGYNDLANVAYTDSGSSAIIELIPSAGYEVTLDSFDMGNFIGNGTTTQYEVYDVNDLVTPLTSSTGINITYNGGSHPTYNVGVSSSNGLRLVLGPDLFANGVDNISYTATASGPPPSGSTSTIDFETASTTWQSAYDTANVDVVLLTTMYGWPSGYNDLTNVAYTDSGIAAIIELIPDSGYEVTLDSFDLGNYIGNGLTTEYAVYDITDLVTPLASSSGINVAYSSSSHDTYNIGVSSSNGLRIVLGPDLFTNAVDNITFTSAASGPPPTSSTTNIQFNEPQANWQTAYDSAELDVVLVSSLYEWKSTGYNDLTNVAYGNSVGSAVIDFLPASGYQVTLDSFDLGNFLGNGGATQYQIFDVTNLTTPLVDSSSISVTYSGSSHPTYSIGLSSNFGLRLVLGPDIFTNAVDNIVVTTDPASVTPPGPTTTIQFNEPMSMWQTAYDSTDVDVVFVSNTYEWQNPGYNDLTNVAYTDSGAPFIVDIIPVSGKQVTLDSFDLGNFLGNGGNTEYQIYDTSNLSTPLFNSSTVSVAYSSTSHPTYTPAITSVNGLRLSVGPDLFTNAIDNITFTINSISVVDTDGDGIPDDDDDCINSILTPTVIIGGVDTGIPNLLLATGCTLADHIAECESTSATLADFLACVTSLANSWATDTIISTSEAALIISTTSNYIDDDGDGVPNDVDVCPNSNLVPTILIGGTDTGIPNVVLTDGCSLMDLITQCEAGASSLTDFLNCMTALANSWETDTIITSTQAALIISTTSNYIDDDNDGVPNDIDICPNSIITPTVIFEGTDTGISNSVLPNGCTLADLIAQCQSSSTSLADFLNCVTNLVNGWINDSTITSAQGNQIIQIITAFIDEDGDTVPNDEDDCPNSIITPTIMLGNHDTGIPNYVLENGCTLADHIALCEEDSNTLSDFLACLLSLLNEWVDDQILSEIDAQIITEVAEIYIDEDGDGVPNDIDLCPNSIMTETVIIDEKDTGVENHLLENGCTIADHIQQCMEDSATASECETCIVILLRRLVDEDILSKREAQKILKAVKKSKKGNDGDDDDDSGSDEDDEGDSDEGDDSEGDDDDGKGPKSSDDDDSDGDDNDSDDGKKSDDDD